VPELNICILILMVVKEVMATLQYKVAMPK